MNALVLVAYPPSFEMDSLRTMRATTLFLDADFSTATVDSYNQSALLAQLSPSEYLVWHALVVASSNSDGSINHYYAASIADVARAIRIQRETVRRALLKLEQKNLARRINERWIFMTHDSDVPTPSSPT